MESEISHGFPVSLLFTLLALVFVLVIAWFAIRLLARIGMGKTGGGRLRILQTVPVGTRERLVLVRFDNQDYLIGVTTGGMTVVDTHDALHSPEQGDSTNP